jgi:PAS domain S-box-containing protein
VVLMIAGWGPNGFPSLAQAAPQTSPSPAPKSILIIYSAGNYLPAYRKNAAAFYSAMEKVGFPVNRLHFEFLDLIRNSSPEYRRQLLAMLASKYADKKIDLIITVEGLARDLMLEEGKNILPGIPLLAILSADALEVADPPRQVLQIPSILDMAGTLKVGLGLFPQTKRVFVVLGVGEDEQRWERDARSKFAPWDGQLEFEYSSALTYEETLERIGSLPPQTIVIYIALYKDKTGRAFVPKDVALALTRKANAPVFGVYDEITPLLVGGSMISYGGEGDRAAKLALDILDARLTLSQPVTTLPILTRLNFNWKQLERWGINDHQLLEGAIVVNRPPSIWEDYKAHVIWGLSLMVLQTGMIIALLELRRRRKKAELIRKEAEERYRLIVDTANEGIWTIDSTRRTTFVNKKLSEMLGYKPEEMIGRCLDEFIYLEDTSAHQLSMEMRLQGLSETYERRWLHKDGRPIWAQVNAAPFFNGQGRFLGSFGMFTDITQRKLTEQALRESEEHYRLLVESANEGIVVAQGGRAKFFNAKMLEINGLSSEEFARQPMVEQVHPDDRAMMIDRARGGIKGVSPATGYEFRIIDKRGEVKWLHANSVPIEWEGRPATLYFITDTTERKRMEEELRHSQAFNSSIIESSPDCIKVLNLEGELEYMSPGGVRLMEIEDLTPYLGMSYERFWSPEDMEAVRQALERARQGDRGGFQRFCPTAAGVPKWWDVNVTPILGGHGQVEKLLAVSRDITARRQEEQEKAKLEAQLRQSQKMEAIGTLAGGIAHDFNNILGAVLGFAEMAHEDALSGHADPRDLEQIMASAQRAKELVQQILAFSRKQEPDLRPLNLNQIVQGTQTILGRTLPKMISVETRLAQGLPPIQADPTQMEQVLLNLASNAADAMPEGGRLVLETQEVVLDAEFCRQHLGLSPGNYVMLAVTDTGTGIDDPTREHIFEPFFTTKEIGKGTGLGLSTAYGIVKNHGGDIYCFSEVGMGTSFKVYLPAFEHAPASPSEEPVPVDGYELTGGKTILLVDDEDVLLRLGARGLRSKGYQVLTATSGEEALQIYGQKGQQLDLVIMDLGMPGMGGHKALREILALDPQAKVVIASGYAADGLVRASLDAGAAGYVAKPYKRADLLATVGRLLDKK